MTNKSWYVYILRCNDHSYYTGITNDVFKRLSTHRKCRGSKYVAARLPFSLIYVETRESKSAALKREYKIKCLTRKEKEAMIFKVDYQLQLDLNIMPKIIFYRNRLLELCGPLMWYSDKKLRYNYVSKNHDIDMISLGILETEMREMIKTGEIKVCPFQKNLINDFE